MGYFDSEKNVENYISMAEGYDGKELIEILKRYLPKDSTVLELGMGPGVDLEILKKTYHVVGSDNSQTFLDRYRKNHKETELLLLDAVTINTEQKFNCVYSNKVLHHLTKEELKRSLLRQKEVLESEGLLFHSFWYGNKVEEHHGMKFTYYTKEELKKIIGLNFKILNMEQYKEMEEEDSIYVLLKKQDNNFLL